MHFSKSGRFRRLAAELADDVIARPDDYVGMRSWIGTGVPATSPTVIHAPKSWCEAMAWQ
jgi:hypothetical protein